MERDLRARWQIEVCSFGAFPDIVFRHGESPIEAATDAKQWPRFPPRSSLNTKSKVRWRHKIPNLAPHFALFRFTNSELSSALVIATRTSGHASAPPPEKQRDYEQHKEYKKQQFRDARRCSSDTAKPKDRCHKRDD